MEDKRLAVRLSRVYAKLLGERDRIDNPPRRLSRLRPDRDAYEAQADTRMARRAEIEVSLEHLAYVIQMLDQDWQASQIEPIKPNAGRGRQPPGGWIGAALDCLRSNHEPRSVAEIVTWISDRYDFDVSTVELRQKYHTAVHNSLIRFQDDLKKVEGYPTRWTLID